MKASGPRHERETVIVFNEEEDLASIWTASQPVYRKLVKLGYPLESDNERSASFIVPRRSISFRRLPKEGARPQRILSAEHKAKLQKGRFKLSGITHNKEISTELGGFEG
jgi:hypothetical protein